MQFAQINLLLHDCARIATVSRGLAQAQIGDLVGPGGSATVLTRDVAGEPDQGELFVQNRKIDWTTLHCKIGASPSERLP